MADDFASEIAAGSRDFLRFDEGGIAAGVTGLSNALKDADLEDEEITYVYVVVAPGWDVPFVFDNFAAARATVGHVLAGFFPRFKEETIEKMLQDIPERTRKWEAGRWEQNYVMYSRQQVRKRTIQEPPLTTLMRGPPTD